MKKFIRGTAGECVWSHCSRAFVQGIDKDQLPCLFDTPHRVAIFSIKDTDNNNSVPLSDRGRPQQVRRGRRDAGERGPPVQAADEGPGGGGGRGEDGRVEQDMQLHGLQEQQEVRKDVFASLAPQI